jgi:hypothetical protein
LGLFGRRNHSALRCNAPAIRVARRCAPPSRCRSPLRLPLRSPSTYRCRHNRYASAQAWPGWLAGALTRRGPPIQHRVRPAGAPLVFKVDVVGRGVDDQRNVLFGKSCLEAVGHRGKPCGDSDRWPFRATDPSTAAAANSDSEIGAIFDRIGDRLERLRLTQ